MTVDELRAERDAAVSAATGDSGWIEDGIERAYRRGRPLNQKSAMERSDWMLHAMFDLADRHNITLPECAVVAQMFLAAALAGTELRVSPNETRAGELQTPETKFIIFVADMRRILEYFRSVRRSEVCEHVS